MIRGLGKRRAKQSSDSSDLFGWTEGNRSAYLQSGFVGVYSIIFLKLIEATVNITISKIAIAAISGKRLVKSPLIIRPLTASIA